MAQTFFPITPTEITPSSANAWVDMDASALIPSGATGVILHVVNTINAARAFGLRKNGSSDDRHPDMYNISHFWAMIGVDGDRIFEAYVESTTNVDIYVVGYTMSGVTFKTNADDKSLTTYNAWLDIDASAEAPDAIGLIFEVEGISSSRLFGFRKNGSSDDRYFGTQYHWGMGAVIGCDESQICEGYLNNPDLSFYLVGYITDGVTFNLNATDLSLGSTGSWLDLTALPDESPVMGIIEIVSGDYNKQYGLRKDESAEDIYGRIRYHTWGIVEPSNRIIEGKIETTGIDFFLVGYATEEVAPPPEGQPYISRVQGVQGMRSWGGI